jgi:hypothetical protein
MMLAWAIQKTRKKPQKSLAKTCQKTWQKPGKNIAKNPQALTKR